MLHEPQITPGYMAQTSEFDDGAMNFEMNFVTTTFWLKLLKHCIEQCL